MSLQSRERIAILDPLRGVAALAVAWYHLTGFPRVAIPGSALQLSGSYGWLGLNVFFVISGFIIPLTLDRAGYQLRDYGRFMLKRVLRLDPPYLIAIGLMLLAWQLEGRLGMPAVNSNPVSTNQLLLHLAYLNAFFNYPWIIGVAWTLAIEFQYYLGVGLLFPLLFSAKRFWSLIAPILALAAVMANTERTVAAWLPLFLTGIAAFHLYTRRIKRREFLIIVVACATEIAFLMSMPAALVTAATACSIAFLRFSPKPLVWLGMISYPLYLLHGVFGNAALYALARSAPSAPLWLLTFISLGIAIATAIVMHLVVERPAQRLSKRIVYSQPRSKYPRMEC